MDKLKICPYCETMSSELVEQTLSIEVKGNKSEMKSWFYKCKLCKEGFTTTETDNKTFGKGWSEQITTWTDFNKTKKRDNRCLNDECDFCRGSGKKENGTPCIHFISCPCPKCSPTY